ncbi:hypothetical protein [Brevibacterium jeotgali]|nr:hypothetical protein [Brevibacterium jeotgali]
MSDGRQIEYTLEGEYRLLQKADELLQVLNQRKAKRKKEVAVRRRPLFCLLRERRCGRA